MIKVEIAFASKNQQKLIELEVAADTKIKDLIIQSQINQFFPEYNLADMPVGIFGKRIFEPDTYELKNGDRIEIYRPLNKSPNQKRLERVKNK
jgi:putative ubiquitin-RnfH superfamily antitoxin RatB of RatAB toxin-antitoxin module